MPWPAEELRRRFAHPQNQALVRYLEKASPSAHSDLGILLIEGIRHLPGAAFFGPNLTGCSYVVAHTEAGIAFAVAVGMRALVLRLPEDHPATKPFDDIGPTWRAFDPFAPTLSRGEGKRLTESLIRHAFESAGHSAG